MFDEEGDLRDLLSRLSPTTRDALCRVLIRDQPDRDEIASMLLHYGDRNGMAWADIIDLLTMYPDERRQVVRLLGELEASPAPARSATAAVS
jgi:hypothetical protein